MANTNGRYGALYINIIIERYGDICNVCMHICMIGRPGDVYLELIIIKNIVLNMATGSQVWTPVYTHYRQACRHVRRPDNRQA
jgi:hypothetical protein